MQKEFDTYEEAEVELNERLQKCYADIEARGDTILGNNSRVIHPFFV